MRPFLLKLAAKDIKLLPRHWQKFMRKIRTEILIGQLEFPMNLFESLFLVFFESAGGPRKQKRLSVENTFFAASEAKERV